MSLNLTDLQQKINNYVTVVADWVRNVGTLYYSGTPASVDVKLLDNNGRVVTRSMPNVAKFRRQVWDDVGAAVGQFNLTLYVDPAGGDDTATGTEADPYRTVAAAILRVPISGSARIVLLGDATLEGPLDMRGRVIVIASKETDSAAAATFTIKSGVDRGIFSSRPSTLIVTTHVTFDGDNAYAIWTNKMDLYILSTLSDKATIRITEGAKSIMCRTLHIARVDIQPADSTCIFLRANTTSSLAMLDTTINGDAATAANIEPYISGIIKDADSGNPINFVSNINFSA